MGYGNSLSRRHTKYNSKINSNISYELVIWLNFVGHSANKQENETTTSEQPQTSVVIQPTNRLTIYLFSYCS